jgi:CheY-specific phosphatase CheX
MILEQAHQQILSETARRIFEEAAFALADSPENGPEDGYSTEPLLSFAVEFSGPFSGILTITTSERLPIILAANMLGMDDSDPDASEKPADALGEILNMICGNFLPAIAGSGPEFQINAPRQMSVETSRQLIMENSKASTARVQLFMEGCKTEIVLLMDAEMACGVFK